jgi:hypothetical protein
MVGANELWVGDGDSTIKVIDLDKRAHIAIIPTGGKSMIPTITSCGDEQNRLPALH